MPLQAIFFVLLLSGFASALTATRKCPSPPTCGWELMELGSPLSIPFGFCIQTYQNFCAGVPIAYLGGVFANQTRDRSQCVSQGGEKEEEYCTCVFECGNGIWSCANGFYRFERGCRKYCHAGACDSDGA